MPRAAACTPAEVNRLSNAIDGDRALGTDAGTLGLSAACLSCATAEYSAANPSPVKWGMSGAQYNSSTPPQLSGGNPYTANYFGCLELNAEASAAAAQALYELAICGSVTCGFEAPCTTDADLNACQRYAISPGVACGTRATAQALATLEALRTSGICNETEGIVQTFCGL